MEIGIGFHPCCGLVTNDTLKYQALSYQELGFGFHHRCGFVTNDTLKYQALSYEKYKFSGGSHRRHITGGYEKYLDTSERPSI